MKKRLLWYGVMLFIFSLGFFGLQDYAETLPLRVEAATPQACSPSSLPIGALPGQPAPMWCYTDFSTGPSTIVAGINSMIDDFNHGLSFADCCNGYTVFNKMRSAGKAVYWRHNDHWMVDSDGMISTMRPNQTFKFENGKLVVEMDVAASVQGYNEKVWPELNVTTASAPTSPRENALYAYDEFAGHYTLGCRLQSTDRHITCSFMDNTNRGILSGGRVYEISFFQDAGAQVFGGEPSGARAKAWRVCTGNDPDMNCRDRFRWEITKTNMTMYVNGIKYMEHIGLPALPDDFMSKELYVYASSWNLNNTGVPYRFHWDRIAVNPKDAAGKLLPPSAAPSYGTTTPSPSPTTTPKPSVNPSTTPTATSSATPTPHGHGDNKNPTSIQFKGDGFGTLPHATYYNGAKGWTIETWFKDESTDFHAQQGYNHPTRFLLTKGDTDTTENIPYILGIEWNTIFVGSRTNWKNKVITYNLSQNKIGSNQWHHVAATYDPSSKQLTMYIDGLAVVKSKLTSYSVKNNLKPLYIGKNGDQHHWIGKVDDVRIWDKARTATEIRDNYQFALTTKPSSLMGNWKFDEGTGNTALDYSAKAEHVTLSKGAWSNDVHISH